MVNPPRMDIAEFLKLVVTTKDDNEPKWFCLSVRTEDHFENIWFRWPDDLQDIVNTALAATPFGDVFFNPRLFREQTATKDNSLYTSTISSDLDYADILRLPVQPTILLNSSPNRHQAHWLLSEFLTGEEFEHLSKKLTYAIENADPSGWTINHKFRLPLTINHKYDAQPMTSVIEVTGRVYAVQDIELLPEPPPVLSSSYDDFLGSEPSGGVGPQELLESIRGKVPAKVYTQYNTQMSDRSSYLWALMCSAFRASLDRDQVLWLAFHSANNKFKEQRSNGLRDLAKDVLRAERAAQQNDDDSREIIWNMRRLGGNVDDKNRMIKDTIIGLMQKGGSFVCTDDDESWYIPSSSGIPIMLSRHSDRLSILLDTRFGLNATEKEHAYVMAGITAFGRSLPSTGVLARMAYYDRPTNSVLIHTGRRDVVRITSTGITIVPNGSFGIVFPWLPNVEPFSPIIPTPNIPSCWADSLFRTSLSNVSNMDPEEAHALMRAWFLFTMFRNDASARPLLALLGQPGSGKTTLASAIYAMVYGKKMELGRISTPENFDMSVSKYPIYFFDNVDTWERWLPDRLATAAKNTKSDKRKLYTDDDIVSVSGSAMIGLTAHDPKFGRADVVDRLLVLQFNRLSQFLPEGRMMQDVYQRRNILWGHLVADIQKVLSTPRPTPQPITLRSADLVHLGRWFANALGQGQIFERAVDSLVLAQKKQALADDVLLLEAIRHYTKKPHDFRTIGAIWVEMSCVGDTAAFSRMYKNAQNLDKRLYVLQASLNALYDIEWREDKGLREWRINERS